MKRRAWRLLRLAAGVHDLPGLVDRLNEARVPAPNGQPWTAELFQREMKRLGA